MPEPVTSRSTVTIPEGCRDDVVPLSDVRAEPLVSAGVTQVAVSALVAGFDWPGPDPRTHLVLVTVDGRGHLVVDGQAHDLVPGTVAVCPAHTPRHHWTGEPWHVVTIRLTEIDLWRRFTATGPFVLHGEDPNRFAAPARGILAELSPATTAVTDASAGRDPLDEFLARFGNPPRRDRTDGLTLPATDPFSLHAVILRVQLELLRSGPSQMSDEQRRLAGLWESVRREPGRDWTVDALADHLNVSRATLHRLVARHHRDGPGAIVERIRMDHASHLLAHSELPVKAIAPRVGYATPYSFSTAFRRVRGHTPSEFRARAEHHGDSDLAVPRRGRRGSPGPPAPEC